MMMQKFRPYIISFSNYTIPTLQQFTIETISLKKNTHNQINRTEFFMLLMPKKLFFFRLITHCCTQTIFSVFTL